MPILTPTPEAGLPAGAGPQTGHAPPSWPDPTVLEQLANTLFQAVPADAGAAPQGLTRPAALPHPADVPGISTAALVAPHAPGRLPIGLPDAAPPQGLAVPGVPGAAVVPAATALPRPGGTAGIGVAAFPVSVGFDALPPGLGEVIALDGRRAIPGDLYFLREARPRDGVPSAIPEEPAGKLPAAHVADFGRLSGAPRPELVPDAARSQHPFDPHAVKRDFPILQQSVHGKPLIWLDNAATTQKPQAVIDRLSRFYEHENSNIHRAAHALAARATDAYEAAREKVRRFLNAGSVNEIVFVRGATEAINLVAQTYGRRHVGEGDEIVVTHLEHHANIVPWQQLAAETGARLKVAPVDDSGQVILEAYEKLLTPRTRIVALAQVSNALGTVVPVREMTAIAHRHGAVVLVDGAQSVSHMPVDVAALGADFFVFSGHKVFGPTGIGVVYGRKEILAHLPPWQGGGNMIADVTFERTVYNGPPERFEAGTGNIADAVGLGAAIDYVAAIGMEVIARYEHELLVYATQRLLDVPGLKLIGTAREKASVLSFVLDGCRPQDVGAALDRDGIAVRAGHHCAQPILRRFGLEATVRPSLAFYNTRDDVDALENALRRIQDRRRHRG